MNETKVCIKCPKTYTRGRGESPTQWASRRFCGRSCAGSWAAMGQAERRRAAKIEDTEWIIGTDAPDNIARRLGYSDLENLRTLLRRWGRDDLAHRLQESVA